MIVSVAMEELHNGIGIPFVLPPFSQYGFYVVMESSYLITDEHKLLLSSVCFAVHNMFCKHDNNKKRLYCIDFRFSPRECEIIKLIYNGKESCDIAELLDISVNTVNTLLRRIFNKAHVNSKIQLITKITSCGWSHMFM